MNDIGWTSLSAANAYFSTRRLDSTHWDALTAVSGQKDEKSAALWMAYDRIRFCPDFTVPGAPTAAQLERLAKAQHELAYYLAAHLESEDRRMGLQAQGVIEAGVVKEKYSEGGLAGLPFPPEVASLLDDFKTTATHFRAIAIGRNEEEGIDYDPTAEDAEELP